MKNLTIDDIDPTAVKKIYTQSYNKEELIEGVRLIQLDNHVSEEGDFCELIRLNENGALINLPFFKLTQINRTKLYSQSIKAWHLHFSQNEIWYISPADHLLVGLWDTRKESKTKLKTTRLVLGGGNSQLLFIPKGIAHGNRNLSTKSVELFYFVDKLFNVDDPDEKRLPWDILGADFWLPQRD